MPELKKLAHLKLNLWKENKMAFNDREPLLLSRVSELSNEVVFLRSVISTLQGVITRLQNPPIFLDKGE